MPVIAAENMSARRGAWCPSSGIQGRLRVGSALKYGHGAITHFTRHHAGARDPPYAWRSKSEFPSPDARIVAPNLRAAIEFVELLERLRAFAWTFEKGRVLV